MKTKIVVDKAVATREMAPDGSSSSEVLKVTMSTSLFEFSKAKLVLELAAEDQDKVEFDVHPEAILFFTLKNAQGKITDYLPEEEEE